jgi:hypothetical protein
VVLVSLTAARKAAEAHEIVLSTIRTMCFTIVSNTLAKARALGTMIVKLSRVHLRMTFAHARHVTSRFTMLTLKCSLLTTILIVSSTIVGLIQNIPESARESLFTAQTGSGKDNLV